METHTEWDLIRRCRSGDTLAFEPLVRAYERRAIAFAETLLGDADEGADAVQDSFVKAFHTLDRLRDGSGFGPWFRTILRNRCLDRLRSLRRSEVPLPDWAEREVSHPDGSDAIERDELSSAVRDALAVLTAEHREVLVLKEMEGLGYAEIGRALRIPPGTVASRLFHARAALKKVLVFRGISLEGVR